MLLPPVRLSQLRSVTVAVPFKDTPPFSTYFHHLGTRQRDPVTGKDQLHPAYISICAVQRLQCFPFIRRPFIPQVLAPISPIIPFHSHYKVGHKQHGLVTSESNNGVVFFCVLSLIKGGERVISLLYNQLFNRLSYEFGFSVGSFNKAATISKSSTRCQPGSFRKTAWVCLAGDASLFAWTCSSCWAPCYLGDVLQAVRVHSCSNKICMINLTVCLLLS